MITLQLGFVGLFWFLLWLVAQLIETKKIKIPEKYLTQGTILSLIIIGFCNTGLFIGASVFLYNFFKHIFCRDV